MPLPAILLPLLMVAADAPINVVGHAWAPFISPMGEPFRAHSPTDDTLADWFYQADRNRDGMLTADEMVADAERFFGTLDADHDGQIDPDELAHYEWEIAPDIQVMSRTRHAPGQRAATAPNGDAENATHDRRRERERTRQEEASLGIGGALQGAARYGLLNMPEPVAAADADFNRAISLDEFKQAAVARFQLLDTAHQDRLTLMQLEALRPAVSVGKPRSKRRNNVSDDRIGNPLPPRN